MGEDIDNTSKHVWFDVLMNDIEDQNTKTIQTIILLYWPLWYNQEEFNTILSPSIKAQNISFPTIHYITVKTNYEHDDIGIDLKTY